jgi:hypothetical protein
VPSSTDPTVAPDGDRTEIGRTGLLWAGLWALVVAGGTAALLLAGWDRVPRPAGEIGAVAVASAYAAGLAARTGGRPVIFGTLALALGAVTIGWGLDLLRTGAAVMTCVTSGLFAVLATRPVRQVLLTLREVAVAVVLASIGALATAGFEPVADLDRFRYASLALALSLILVLVYRLGAGLHGLGRRGLVFVLVASVIAALTLVYAELLQRYGDTVLVGWSTDIVDWTTDRIGTFPAPLATLLGIPALVWGTYLRSRRRQGWWVCAFGVAATVPIGYALVLPDSWHDIWLRLAATVVAGLVIGLTICLIDRWALNRRERRGSRRAIADVTLPPRPEPQRWQPLS